MGVPSSGFFGRHYRCLAITIFMLVIGFSLVGFTLIGAELPSPRAFRPHRPPPPPFHSSQILHRSGPSDPYAEKVFLMLKTGAKASRARLPIHFEVTFPRWPHYAVYGDIDMIVMGQPIIGLFDSLPSDILQSDVMAEYRLLKQMEKEHWQWDPNEISSDKGWITDKFKNMPMLAHAWKEAPEETEWFFFIDDDTYVFQDNVLQWLKTQNPRDALYFGSQAPTVVREDGQTTLINFAHGGSGVIISRGAMIRLFGPLHPAEASQKKINDVLYVSAFDAMNDCCGDAIVAQELWKEANVAYDQIFDQAPVGFGPFQANPLVQQRFSIKNWCVPVFTWHGVTARETEELYNYEVKRLEKARKLAEEPNRETNSTEYSILYGDLYRDMVMGHIVKRKEDWYIGQPNLKLTAAEVANNAEVQALVATPERILEPHANDADCQKVCEVFDRCLSWSFTPGECGLFDGFFSLGRAYNHFEKNYNPEIKAVTGWIVDRIREVRNNATCDPLVIKDGHASDESEFNEGWLIRSLEGSQPN